MNEREDCQCPKCGRLHHKLANNPPAAIAGPSLLREPELCPPSDPRIDTVAHALHAIECEYMDRERERGGLPPVEKWADPWAPGGARQLRNLRLEAIRIVAALDATPRIPLGLTREELERLDRLNRLRRG